MRVGIVGVGKLAGPIFQEVSRTHEVYANDVFCGDDLRPIPAAPEFPNLKIAGKQYLLDCDLVFVAVQTPHGPEYEGVTRLPETRADFDYRHLTAAIKQLADAGEKHPPLVVISTVLPGTIEREVLPLWTGPVAYNPYFIAMGTEVDDFLDPEFVLLGGATHPADLLLAEFYRSLGIDAPIFTVGYREAELAKMAYNTWISGKIALANTIGEFAHRLGIDSQAVMTVLLAADRRIVSRAYMEPGMGDGGGCHPRDCIALSWLARETGMSFDLFGALMEQREAHAEWLADLVCEHANVARDFDWRDGERNQEHDIVILGRSYKPGTLIETGSPAMLVANLLRERGVEFEHVAELG